MKKLLAVLLVVCMLPFGIVAFAEEYPVVDVMVNGKILETDQPAVIYQDRTIVPIRAICEALGCDVSWNSDTKTAIIKNSVVEISVVIDSNIIEKTVTADNKTEKFEIDVPAMILNDRTLVPLRAVSESFDAKVTWDGEARCVYIETEDSVEESAEDRINQLFGTEGINFVNGAPRYNFEQKILPASVFKNEAVIHDQIMKKDESLEKVLDDIWYDNLVNALIEDGNEPFENDPDKQIVSYVSTKYGLINLLADEHFSTGYETLKDGSVMLLIEFNNTDGLVLCKHIGITAQKDGGIRYFTSETDMFTDDTMFFCEIIPSARGTLGYIGFEKEDFIKAAEHALEFGMSIEENATEVIGGVVTPEGYISKKYGIGITVTEGVKVIDPETVKSQLDDSGLTAMAAMGDNIGLTVSVYENELSSQSFEEVYEGIINITKSDSTLTITDEQTDAVIAGKESKIVSGTVAVTQEETAYFKFCYIKSGECVIELAFSYNENGKKDAEAIMEKIYAITE